MIASDAAHPLARASATPRYVFNAPALNAALARHVANPDAYELDQELSLAKLCLESVISKVRATSLSALEPESIAVILATVREVAGIVKSIAETKQSMGGFITIEQLVVLVELVAGVAMKHVPAERHQALLDDLAALPWPGGEKYGRTTKWSRRAASLLQQEAGLEVNLKGA